MSSVYTIQDIYTGQNYDLVVYEGVLSWSVSTNPANVNPIVLDLGDNVTLWQISIGFGMIQWSIVTNAVTTPIFYLQDSFDQQYYQVAVKNGELEWFTVVPSTGGSSGPLNPYDVYRIFNKKKYKTRVSVHGKRIVASGMLLAVLGSTKSTVNDSKQLAGDRVNKITETVAAEGLRKFSLVEGAEIAGTRSVAVSENIALAGTRHCQLTETKEVVGTKDLRHILAALNLI